MPRSLPPPPFLLPNLSIKMMSKSHYMTSASLFPLFVPGLARVPSDSISAVLQFRIQFCALSAVGSVPVLVVPSYITHPEMLLITSPALPLERERQRTDALLPQAFDHGVCSGCELAGFSPPW